MWTGEALGPDRPDYILLQVGFTGQLTLKWKLACRRAFPGLFKSKVEILYNYTISISLRVFNR